MKQRLFKNWTFLRLFYLLVGGFVVVQSVISAEWFAVAFGLYFASMGLFNFGCAAGNCGYTRQVDTTVYKEPEFEEIKQLKP